MRKVQLFIASSIDGFIACRDGSIAWLFTDADYGYDAFYEQVDTVLIGRKTFEQVLSFGEWPYPGRAAYVFSRDAVSMKAPEGISDLTFTSQPPSQVVTDLLKQPGKNIWLVGGAAITGDLLSAGLLDEMVLSIHPIVLGKGIPLVSAYSQPGPEFDYWKLVNTQSYPSGLVQLSYAKRPSPTDQASTSASASSAASSSSGTMPATVPVAAPAAAPVAVKAAAAAAEAAEKLASKAPPPSLASAEPVEPKTPTGPAGSPAPAPRDTPPHLDQGPAVASGSTP